MPAIIVTKVRAYNDPGWRAVAAAFAFNGALFGTWASRVPAFKGQFSLDAAELGLLLLALAAGAIVSFPLAGLLSDRLGPKRVTGVLRTSPQNVHYSSGSLMITGLQSRRLFNHSCF